MAAVENLPEERQLPVKQAVSLKKELLVKTWRKEIRFLRIAPAREPPLRLPFEAAKGFVLKESQVFCSDNEHWEDSSWGQPSPSPASLVFYSPKMRWCRPGSKKYRGQAQASATLEQPLLTLRHRLLSRGETSHLKILSARLINDGGIEAEDSLLVWCML